jgi:hypothetical protein
LLFTLVSSKATPEQNFVVDAVDWGEEFPQETVTIPTVIWT